MQHTYHKYLALCTGNAQHSKSVIYLQCVQLTVLCIIMEGVSTGTGQISETVAAGQAR